MVDSTVSGGETEVQTEPGSLYEAVPNGELNSDLGDLGSAHALNADARKLSRAIAHGDSGESDSVPFDQTVTCTDSAEMTLTGSLTTAVGPHLSIKWHKFIGVPVGIDKASATLDATVEAEAEGRVSGEDTCKLEPITLFDPEWETIIDVAGVPVPVTISVPIELSGSAGVSASVAVKASAEARGSLGVSYEHGELSGIHEFSSSAEAPEPTIEAEATLQASIGPDATITAGWQVKHLGGVAAKLGVGVSSGLKLTYAPLSSPPGSICVPFEVTGSVALELPFDTIEKSGSLYEGNIKCVDWGEAGGLNWEGTINYHGNYYFTNGATTAQGSGSAEWQVHAMHTPEGTNGENGYIWNLPATVTWEGHAELSSNCTDIGTYTRFFEGNGAGEVPWAGEVENEVGIVRSETTALELDISPTEYIFTNLGTPAGEWRASPPSVCGEDPRPTHFFNTADALWGGPACMAGEHIDNPIPKSGSEIVGTETHVDAGCDEGVSEGGDTESEGTIEFDLTVTCPDGSAPDDEFECAKL